MKINSKITLAKTAGFCFGVNRAIKLIYELLDKNEKVCTLGPIIHNNQVVEELESRGVIIAESTENIPAGYTAVIRTHGVSLDVYNELDRLNIKYIDATCPYVKKIHNIVKGQSKNDDAILIIGDNNHPEVIGIKGNCTVDAHVCVSCDEIEKFIKSYKNTDKNSLSIVAQTTFSQNEWKKCIKTIEKVYTNATVFDTICNATFERQNEAEMLSKISDVMIVIGSHQSSNTKKLKEVCKNNTKSFLIETAKDLPKEQILDAKKIGVTAGASTPAIIIKEVLVVMSEILNNNENTIEEKSEINSSEEMSFEAALEESLKKLNSDQKVKGIVVGIAPNEVYVDVGRKQAGFVPLDELTSDPNAKPEDVVKIGDEINLLIMRTDDQAGTIKLSKRRLDAAAGWEEIIKANEDGTIIDGTVIQVIKGGVLAIANDVRIFIPASQTGTGRDQPLENLLNKKVKFKVIEVNRQRRRAVGSIRIVSRELRKENEKIFWESAEVGKFYNGTVKSLTAYGAFVDIGGIDGMVHISELSWGKVKKPEDVVSVGDILEVYIKDLDQEKKRISLGYKKTEDNPIEILKKSYPVDTVTKVKIVGLTAFGAFAQIIEGVDGLIHISQISDKRIDKPSDVLKVGDEVTAKITDIDLDKKRVSLSIKALIEKEDKPVSEEPDEVVASTDDSAETVNDVSEPAENNETEDSSEQAE